MTRWTLLRRAVWLAGVAALVVAPLPAAAPTARGCFADAWEERG